MDPGGWWRPHRVRTGINAQMIGYRPTGGAWQSLSVQTVKLATGFRQVRGDQKDLGPTGLGTGCSSFLPSLGCKGQFLLSGTWYGAPFLMSVDSHLSLQPRLRHSGWRLTNGDAVRGELLGVLKKTPA